MFSEACCESSSWRCCGASSVLSVSACFFLFFFFVSQVLLVFRTFFVSHSHVIGLATVLASGAFGTFFVSFVITFGERILTKLVPGRLAIVNLGNEFILAQSMDAFWAANFS